VEAARRILEADGSRAWRIAAAFALASALHYGHMSLPEALDARSSLQSARQLGDPLLRAAVDRILSLSPSEFRDPALSNPFPTRNLNQESS
jgi:hypothetical protein